MTAEADSNTRLRLISSIVVSLSHRRAWCAVGAAEPLHDFGKLRTQRMSLRRVAIARPLHVDGHVLADATGRWRHDRDAVGKIDGLVDVVGDIDDRARLGEPGV